VQLEPGSEMPTLLLLVVNRKVPVESAEDHVNGPPTDKSVGRVLAVQHGEIVLSGTGQRDRDSSGGEGGGGG